MTSGQGGRSHGEVIKDERVGVGCEKGMLRIEVAIVLLLTLSNF
jgi:hypothetical protein